MTALAAIPSSKPASFKISDSDFVVVFLRGFDNKSCKTGDSCIVHLRRINATVRSSADKARKYSTAYSLRTVLSRVRPMLWRLTAKLSSRFPRRRLRHRRAVPNRRQLPFRLRHFSRDRPNPFRRSEPIRLFQINAVKAISGSVATSRL